MLLKLISPFPLFLNVTAKYFKILCVALRIFPLGSAGLDYIRPGSEACPAVDNHSVFAGCCPSLLEIQRPRRERDLGLKYV